MDRHQKGTAMNTRRVKSAEYINFVYHNSKTVKKLRISFPVLTTVYTVNFFIFFYPETGHVVQTGIINVQQIYLHFWPFPNTFCNALPFASFPPPSSVKLLVILQF